MDSSAANNAEVSPSARADLSETGVRGTAWIALQSLIVNLASLAVFIVLGRLLDPKAFGLVAAASVVVLFMRLLVDGGISKGLIQREVLTEDLINSAFWTAVSSGVVLTVFVIAVAPLIARLFQEPELVSVIRALSCVIIFASLDRTQSALLDRRMAFRIQAIRGSIAALCSATAAILAAFAGWGVWALVVQTITFELVNLALLWSLSGWRPRFTFSRHHIRELLPFGSMYLSIVVVQYLNLNVDNLLIGVFLGPVALGVYVVAYRILIVSNEILVMTVSRVGLAAFSRLQNNELELQKVFYGVAGLSAAIALPLYVGLALLAPDLIHLLFGAKWGASIAVMQVLCIAGITQAITSFTHPLVIAIGKVRDELRWNLVACALYMIGFAASVHFGITAVAWSIAIISTVLVPARIYLMERWAGVAFGAYFARLAGPAAATAVMAAALFGFGQIMGSRHGALSFAEAVILGAVCYSGSLVLFDRNAAKSLVRVLQSFFK